MKKYIVIGNPIEHSLSPKLHNYWMDKNNIKASYDKKLVYEEDIESIINEVKKKKIQGINVTVPFKKSVIPFLDELSQESKETQSVNTILLENKKLIGHNTDIAGFELALRHANYDVKSKKIFILGAGGVVPSIIFALKKMSASKIILSNRTLQKSEELQNYFKDIEIIKWGNIPSDFDMIINATSVGLKKDDNLNLNYEKIDPNKFFYDLIYNPKETNFLKKAKQNGNKFENGKMMFLYQAHQAFTLWHKIMPDINKETIKLLD
jgi:shikimate dehydrogenase